MMVLPKIKCVLCHLPKSPCIIVNNEFMGRSLFGIITNLCDGQVKKNIKPTDNVCAECAMELWRADKVITEVRNSFGQKSNDIINKSLVLNGNSNTSSNEADVFIFHCKTCKFNTTKLKLYKEHMLKLHGKTIFKAYMCDQCDQAFARYDHFNLHRTKVHSKEVEPGNIKSKVDDKTKINDSAKFEKIKEIKMNSEIENNVKKTNSNKIVIKDVNKSIKMDANKSIIKDATESDVLFKCPECKYTSDKPKVFRRHMMNIHECDKNEVFRCDKCPKMYSLIYAYKQHMEKHQNEQLANETSKKIKLETDNYLQSNFSVVGSTTISDQTLNNAKAMSTPLSTQKKHKNKVNKKVITTAQPIDEQKKEEKPISIECSTLKKPKKKKHVLDVPETEELPVKKKKIFENIDDTMDAETTIGQESGETYACSQCTKTVSSLKKLEKHILKKHST